MADTDANLSSRDGSASPVGSIHLKNEAMLCESSDSDDIRFKGSFEPMIVTREEYRDIFGDSSDEDCEFFGFAEEELGLKEFRSFISPNKLKLQNDFYLPLCLSHRRRKKCLTFEKADDKYENIDKKEAGEILHHENEHVSPKQTPEPTFKINAPAIKSAFSEPTNPYAKQYKSYRRERNGSISSLLLEKDNKDGRQAKTRKDNGIETVRKNINKTRCNDDKLMLQQNVPEGEENKHSDLKLRIQYQSSTRPRRNVIVPEREDFLYEINRAGRKRQRSLPTTVIRDAKIIKLDNNCDDVEEAEGNQSTHDSKNMTSSLKTTEDPVADAVLPVEREEIAKLGTEEEKIGKKDISNKQLKSKKKKRFKNISSITESYPLATMNDILIPTPNAENVCDASTQEIVESVKDKMNEIEMTDECVFNGVTGNLSMEFDIKNDSQVEDLNTVEQEKYATADKEDEHESSNLKTLNDVEDQKKSNESTKSLVTADSACEGNVDAASLKYIEDHDVIIEKDSVSSMLLPGERSCRDKVADARKLPVNDAEHCNNQKTSNADKTNAPVNMSKSLSEGNGNQRRLTKKIVPPKAKSINLTDTWFSVSPVVKRRHKPKEKCNDDAKDMKHSISSQKPDSAAMNEEDQKVSIPFVGKTVPSQRRSLLSRKRRLKNVSCGQKLEDTTILYTEKANDNKFRVSSSKLVTDNDLKNLDSLKNESLSFSNEKCDSELQHNLRESKKQEVAKHSETIIDEAELKTLKKTIDHRSASGNSSSRFHSLELDYSTCSKRVAECSQNDTQQNVTYRVESPMIPKNQSLNNHDRNKLKSGISMEKNLQNSSPSSENLKLQKKDSVIETELNNLTLSKRKEKSGRPDSSAILEKNRIIKDRNEGDVVSKDTKPISNTEKELFVNNIDETGKKRKVGEMPGRRCALSNEEKDIARSQITFSKPLDVIVPDVDWSHSSSREIRKASSLSCNNSNSSCDGKTNVGKVRNDEGSIDSDISSMKKVLDEEVSLETSSVFNGDRVPSDKAEQSPKVKRKVYTVVRKIRRTEINADGKKVTKIIKQIVKKVCPVDSNQVPNQETKEKDERKAIRDEKIFPSEEEPDVKNDHSIPVSVEHKSKTVTEKRCGKCIGCLRTKDCNTCGNCKKRKDGVSSSDAIRCIRKKCSNFKVQRKRNLPVKKKIQKVELGSGKSSASTVDKDEKGEPSGKSESVESSSPHLVGKPKSKAKGTKSNNKIDPANIVYAPGFKLRSKVTDSMTTRPRRVLKEVQYSGLEPTVKLPWPDEQMDLTGNESGNFFCITSPVAITAKDICFHCGSGGFLKMIYCTECSEAYHDFCIDIDPLDEQNWLCDRCKRCTVCGYRDNLLMCDVCHDCYHVECLGPNYHKETEGAAELWVCAKCVKCVKCGSKTPGKRKESRWMKDFTLCEECDRKMKKGQYCFVCEELYAENDYDTKMMFCTICEKWIHMECEGLSVDEYECLAELPDNIPYICKKCHDKEVWPRWYQEVREEINAGFEKIYYELVASEDYKIVKKYVPELKLEPVTRKLDEIFNGIQENKFKAVANFVLSFEDFFIELSAAISEIIPAMLVSDIRTFLREQVESMFPWNEDSSPTEGAKDDIKSVEKNYGEGTKVDVYAIPAISLDHSYCKGNSKCNGSESKHNEGIRSTIDIVNSVNSDQNQEQHVSNEPDLSDGGSQSNHSESNIFDKLYCKERSFNEVQDLKCEKQSNYQTFKDVDISIENRVCFDSKKDEDNKKSPENLLLQSSVSTDQTVSSRINDSNVDETRNPNERDNEDIDAVESGATMRTAKHNDDRRCLLCNQYGDEHKNEAGRILSAGVNEWVHVNCALWSAEVYEDDSGMLQNVHAALARGQKLRCSVCQQWGATVGCCAANCPSNYHFMCARNTSVLFQDNKIVYCDKHKHKSKDQVIRTDDAFCVLRPVVVDMSKVLGQKKFHFGRDPDSITIYSGSLVVNRLGRLSEASDNDHALLPVGFRATRSFWNPEDSNKRCKYYMSIEEKQNKPKFLEKDKEDKDVCFDGWTVCHNVQSPPKQSLNQSTEDASSPCKKRIKLAISQSPQNISLSSGSSQISMNGNKYNKVKVNKDTTKAESAPSEPSNSKSQNTHRNNLENILRIPVDIEKSLKNMTSKAVDLNTSNTRPTRIFSFLQNDVAYRSKPPIIAISKPIQVTSNASLYQQTEGKTTASKKSTCTSNAMPSIPRLIQPKLQYPVYPSALHLVKNDSASTTLVPILPKSSNPAVGTLEHFHSGSKPNSHLLNFVGNTTIDGLSHVLGSFSSSVLSQSMTSSTMSSSSAIPCYTVNSPEQLLRLMKPRLFPQNNLSLTSTVSPDLPARAGNIQASAVAISGKRDNENFVEKVPASNTGDSGRPSGAKDYSGPTNSYSNAIGIASSRIQRQDNARSEENDCVISEESKSRNFTDKILPEISRLCERLPKMPEPMSRFIKSNTSNVNSLEKHGSSTTGTLTNYLLSSTGKLKATSNLEPAEQSSSALLEDGKTLKSALHQSNTNINLVGHKSAKMSASYYITEKGGSKTSIVETETKNDSRRNKKWYVKKLQKLLCPEVVKKDSALSVIIKNEAGLRIEGDCLEDVWKKLVNLISNTRVEQKLSPLHYNVNDAYEFFGLSKFPTAFLAEQLPGGHKCRNYKFQYHLPCIVDEDKELPINPSGCARGEIYTRQSRPDMFAWLASPYRAIPTSQDDGDNESEQKTASDLPLSMRFRQLKSNVKDHVGVYRSLIEGRGLFCKRQIETGEMVIEYAGSVIRGILTDKREHYYDGKGYGCYMFRIDDTNVVDATLFGNEARFINHSCEPNCYSRIVSVDGKKHIVIFAARRIIPGEELTYDYKFPFEEEKLPCHCGSKKCRKYLN